jgi:uncharacterized protein DUF3551
LELTREKLALGEARTQLPAERCSVESEAKGIIMKAALSLLGVLFVTAAITTPAQAQSYPWCAYYGGRFGGASNCGFSTYQQCLATVSGIGGYCQPNTMYVPPPSRHRHDRAHPY